eukprot:518100-Rhodomonas_salina.1
MLLPWEKERVGVQQCWCALARARLRAQVEAQYLRDVLALREGHVRRLGDRLPDPPHRSGAGRVDVTRRDVASRPAQPRAKG